MQANDLPQINGLAGSTVLLRLKRSMFQPYAHDAAQTSKVEAETGVRKAGRFNKRLLLDCHELSEANSAYNDVYQYVTRNTVPWLDDGVRWMPAARYMEVSQGIGELVRAAKNKVETLASRWDLIVAKDMQRLGPLANPSDYPIDIRACYQIAVRWLPVPSSADFRVSISDEDKASLNDAIEDAKKQASKYLIAQMLEPIKKAVEKLSIPIGEEGSIFRDTLLTNITEVLDRAQSLNFLNDPTVNTMIADTRKAVGAYAVVPDMLREDTALRSDAQSKLDAIMAKMAGLY